MSVNSYLTQVSSKLVLSENEKNSMNASIHTLKSQIDSYFEQTIKTHFQFGSSTRGTILPVKADSNSDIDYMIVFNILDRKQEPQIYFEELRRFVDKNYSANYSSGNILNEIPDEVEKFYLALVQKLNLKIQD